MAEELVGMLKAAGIRPDKIVVWDRRLDELKAAGYDASKLGCRLEGTLDAPGKKGSSRGYEFDSVCVAGQTTHLSGIQTRGIDHLINVAVMKNHFITGYTGALKNHYGTIDNPGEFHGSIHKRPSRRSTRWTKWPPRRACSSSTPPWGSVTATPMHRPTACHGASRASIDPVALDARRAQDA